MRHSTATALLVLGITHLTDGLKQSEFCFDGCELTLNYVAFTDASTTLPKKVRRCRSIHYASSLYLCISQYCKNDGRDAWLVERNEDCRRLVNETLPPYDIVYDYAPEDVANLRRLHAEEGLWNAKNKTSLSEVVIPDETFFEQAYKTLNYVWFEVDIHRTYGIAIYYFWTFVISVGICIRLVTAIRKLRHQEWEPVPNDDFNEAHYIKDGGKVSFLQTLVKTYITMPATFGYRCSQNIGWCTIPSRIQSITIFSFVVLNVLFCSISYRTFEGNLYWPSVSTQMWRYVSDRTGVMSLANLPLVWFFGTRNNLLMWLTGWGFGTYNNFHRWVARVATVQAVVHSIGYTVLIFEDGGGWQLFMKYWTKRFFWNGELATIFMCGICAFSVYGLRRSHYEVFLVTHIVFSVIVLLTMYYHVEIFNGEWNIFIWPCLLVWVLDRLLRGLRILAFNHKFWNTRASATYDASSNLIRLSIPCSQSFLQPKPGTYYYIYILDDLLFMHQNHPFTLAYVDHGSRSNTATDHGEASMLLTTRMRRPSTQRTTSSSSTESDSLLPSTPVPTRTTSSLTFLIRPYDGMTRRLASLCSSSSASHLASSPSSQSTTLPVLLEGPYGSTTPFHSYPNILFVVGGSGIAVPLSYLRTLLSEDNNNRLRTVHIVWAVREPQFLDAVLRHDFPRALGRDAEEEAGHGRRESERGRSGEGEGDGRGQGGRIWDDERIRLTVHITQGDEEEFKDDTSSPLLPPYEMLKGVTIRAGRPDVYAAVASAAADAGNERLAVVACGPAQMADDARRASVNALRNGCKGVEYFEESFKW